MMKGTITKGSVQDATAILAVMEEYGTNSDVKWTISEARDHDFDIGENIFTLQNKGLIKSSSNFCPEHRFIVLDEYN